MQMLTVLANLFTRYRMPPSFDPDDKSSYPADSDGTKKFQIYLTGLPDNMEKSLNEFNRLATELYYKFMAAASKNKELLVRFIFFLLQKNFRLHHFVQAELTMYQIWLSSKEMI